MSFSYDGLVKAPFIPLALAAALLVACNVDNTEKQLQARLEGFFENVLNGDAATLDDYVSESCSKPRLAPSRERGAKVMPAIAQADEGDDGKGKEGGVHKGERTV